jgi:glycerol-3-phosphate O-acyltransferase
MTEELTPLQDDESKPADDRSERASWGDPLSAMTPRYNFFFRWFAKRYFRHFKLDDATVNTLRDLESRGAVVYVMRYSSRLDYFLFNTLFASKGLRLSSFANGIHFQYYRPIFEALRATLGHFGIRSQAVVHRDDREYTRRLSLGGQSLFIFLRTARFRRFLRGRRGDQRSSELDLLEEVVRTVWDTDRPVFFVPLSLFWRKGPRLEHRFLNLSYGSLTRPSDVAKVSSFLANYSSLAVKVGESIDLQRFNAGHRDEGPAQVARKVRRSILIYLYREEKVVRGPTLRAPHRVQREVLADHGVQAAMADRVDEGKYTRQRVQYQAERMFSEIAANMNSTFLAALNQIMHWIFRRMFASIEVEGLEKVARYVKEHPVVLVPSHRSYFDFLILSPLFYSNHMIPPHIAARENMAFGPFGYIFRRVGAFFLRRSFDDELYKQVFRSYVAYLVRDGFMQEFFIEGGRSRTGKSLAPRLGMLSWDVEAFIESPRRDLVFIPVGITYERLVEESLMVDELKGGAKTKESMRGLLNARKYLQRRFGRPHVCFGEPIHLAEALGELREPLRELASGKSVDPEIREDLEGQRRDVIERLGWQIIERINWTATVNATSVAACVMMGAQHRGLRRDEMVERMGQVVEILRLQDTRLTKALASDTGDFQESIAFLLRAGLIQTQDDEAGEVLYFDEPHRAALDIYRNTIVHYLATPSFLARLVLAGTTRDQMHSELQGWQEIFYQEFYAPRGDRLTQHCDVFAEYFVASGWAEEREGGLCATDAGQRVLSQLAEQTRGVIDVYLASCDAVEGVARAVEVDSEAGSKPDSIPKPEVAEADGASEDHELTSKAMRGRVAGSFEVSRLLGGSSRPESGNDTTYDNAIDLMVRRGILQVRQHEVVNKKVRYFERRFSRSQDAAALDQLRAELNRALAPERPTLPE